MVEVQEVRRLYHKHQLKLANDSINIGCQQSQSKIIIITGMRGAPRELRNEAQIELRWWSTVRKIPARYQNNLKAEWQVRDSSWIYCNIGNRSQLIYMDS